MASVNFLALHRSAIRFMVGGTYLYILSLFFLELGVLGHDPWRVVHGLWPMGRVLCGMVHRPWFTEYTHTIE